jgi:FHS family L-fucose permease-like MFS transporter
MIALVAVSFFMSIMYPTIFALALKDMGPLAKSGSSFLVMAIIGGALVPLAVGAISDMANIYIAMLVPALCFVMVGLFALSARRRERMAAPA